MQELFYEIDKFKGWAEKIPSEKKLGGWELDYSAWPAIYKSFDNFLAAVPYKQWCDTQIKQVLYIVARDNGTQQLLYKIYVNSVELLCFFAEQALKLGEADAKWQFAVQLGKCAGKEPAAKLLEKFWQDNNEYVSRRALLAMADLRFEKTEEYCVRAWNGNKYIEMEEYQKIGVLHALHRINSPLLPKYLKLAKKDGRKYLLQNAEEIETGVWDV